MTSEYIARPDDCILVTGSNGFIGARIVETLLGYGFSNLRCFVRPSSQLGSLENASAASMPARMLSSLQATSFHAKIAGKRPKAFRSFTISRPDLISLLPAHS